MSAVAGVVHWEGESAGSHPFEQATLREGDVATMLTAMESRGADRVEVASAPLGTLGVARYDWEMGPGFSEGDLTLQEGPHVLVADATLYRLPELRRRLKDRGETPRSDGPGSYILAAYRAWGEELSRHIEGDFAFLLWDARRKVLVASRSFSGFRSLFFSEVWGGILAASSPAGILAHPVAESSVDLVTVTSRAAGLWCSGPETCYQGMSELRAGRTMVATPQGVRIRRHWTPPSMEVDREVSSRDAPDLLRELLVEGASERLDDSAPTAVWMSGGWDSTSVFAASRVASTGQRKAVFPVSMSYPPGDPGREDERIEEIAAWWDADVTWVESDGIRLLGPDPLMEASRRTDAFHHPFSEWNRALARAARDRGARVAFSGYGGDQLFQVSPIYLADLLRSLRLSDVVSECRSIGLTRPKAVLRHVLLPALPAGARSLVGRLTGRWEMENYLLPQLSPWFRDEFMERMGVQARERAWFPSPESDSRSDAETLFYLVCEYFPRVASHIHAIGLEEGVELRAPLYDRRVIEFALRRPREERCSFGETKRLLRASMKGILPPSVLTPRTGSTGTTGGFLKKTVRRHHTEVFDAVFQDPILEDLEIVDGDELRRAWTHFRSGGKSGLGTRLFLTLGAELWLRSRELRDPPKQSRVPAPVMRAGVSAGEMPVLP